MWSFVGPLLLTRMQRNVIVFRSRSGTAVIRRRRKKVSSTATRTRPRFAASFRTTTLINKILDPAVVIWATKAASSSRTATQTHTGGSRRNYSRPRTVPKTTTTTSPFAWCSARTIGGTTLCRVSLTGRVIARFAPSIAILASPCRMLRLTIPAARGTTDQVAVTPACTEMQASLRRCRHGSGKTARAMDSESALMIE